MAIENRDLIEEYFNQIKTKYSWLSLEECLTICRTPFLFFRKQMESPDFPLVHVKYFGKFVVWPGSAKKVLHLIQMMWQNGRLTEEQYNERTVNLKAYIEKYEYENQDSPSSQGEESTD